MTKTVLLWGARTKARIIEHMARQKGLATVMHDPALGRPDDETLAPCTHYAVCIHSSGGDGRERMGAADYLERELRLDPLDFIAPSAIICDTVRHGPGLQAMAGAVVHHFTTLGAQCIVNTNATVDHDCTLGDGVHVMGAASIAGCVTIGDYAAIGTNATVLPRLSIGPGAFVGAGAVVTRDVPANAVVAGNPARIRGYTESRRGPLTMGRSRMSR